MGAWPGRLRANGVFHHGWWYRPGARRHYQDCEAVAPRPTFIVIRPFRVSSVGDSSRSLAAPDVPALLTVGFIGVRREDDFGEPTRSFETSSSRFWTAGAKSVAVPWNGRPS